MGQDISVFNFLIRVSDKMIYTQAVIVIYCLFAITRGLALTILTERCTGPLPLGHIVNIK